MSEFSERKYGFVALGLCIAEITFIWGNVALINTMGVWRYAPRWLADGFIVMYLVGLALLLSLVNLVVCAIPLANSR